MDITNITPLVYIKTFDKDVLSNLYSLNAIFSNVIALKPKDTEYVEITGIQWIEYIRDDGKVSALNNGIEQIHTPYLLYLDGCERINSEEIEELRFESGTKSLVHAQITCRVKENSNPKKYVQPRIIPVQEGAFKGFWLPDVEESFDKFKWKENDLIIHIERNTDLIDKKNIENESALAIQTRQAVFWGAVALADKGEFAESEKKFRALIQKPSNFTTQHLAELNGLAYVLKELKEWKLSANYAKKSMALEERQKAPYLLLFEMYFAFGRWEKAYQCLEKYAQHIHGDIYSATDVFLDTPDFHYLLAECAFKMHHFEQAFDHYQKYYKLMNGNVKKEILEKLFIYSIDLKDYENSVRYFYKLFSNNLFELNDEVQEVKLFESLSLFMDNGWHDFVCQIYEELHNSHPDDNRILQGWIAVLVRAKKLDKAKSLLPFSNRRNKKAVSSA